MNTSDISLPSIYQDIFQSSRDALIVRDLDHKVHAWNIAAEALYGWPAKHVVGRSLLELIYGESYDATLNDASLLRNGVWSGELDCSNSDGASVPVKVSQRLVVNTRAEPVAVVEQHIRIRQKGEDPAYIVHQMNNVLAPILLSAALLERTLSDEKSKEMLTRIEECAQEATDLIAKLAPEQMQ